MTQPDLPPAPKAWEFTTHVPPPQALPVRLEPTALNVPSVCTQLTGAPSVPGPVSHVEPVGVSRQTLPPSTVMTSCTPLEMTYPPIPVNMGVQVTGPYPTHDAAHVHPTIGKCGPVACILQAAYTPPMAASTGFHGPASYYPTTPPTHITYLTTQMKLPKLNMRKFDGNLTKWSTFWDSFASSVHKNPSHSSIDKFNYLARINCF